ncbi:2-acyl-glycerophospho-ethanolamine acyltransferase [Micromonospora sp. MW-13]|uniref:MFS transporter n=1 Tax=unclassified Micromonospora TaxID=2617518 RepID=UPI000E44561C|nr:MULTISPECIES: MFS transporter [unclassified Micromonospora]MCX4468839.1 MFS transporter [Micromonospora sp. NBC_01655]RGC68458.1 2-acyl-glycerophospho-ethanolamine acyltransferase [Micromonospora sp. MW-13]
MSFASVRSRWSDVWLATVARGVSSCGDFLAASALTLALQSAGAGGTAVSGLLIAATLPLVALAPLTGRLADRVDSRTLLVGAGLAQAAICLALAYARHPALVIGLVALLAAGLAVTQPVLSALVPAMVRPADLPRASALNQTAGTLGALAGPALAGLLVGGFGTRLPLLVDAASYLVLVAAGLLIRTRRGGARSAALTPGAGPTPGAEPATRGAGPTAAGWRLRRDRLLVAMVASLAGVIGAVGAINVIEVFFIRETLGSSTTVYGLVTGSWTLGVVLGAWALAPLARRLTDDGRLLGTGLLLLGGCCVAVLVSAAVPSAWLLVPVWLLGGVANGGDNVLNNVLMARRVPQVALGRAYAVFGAATQGASMVGFAAGGLLLELAEPRPLVAACGLAGTLAVGAFAVPVARAARAERVAAARRGGAVLRPDAELATSRAAR